MNKKQKELLEQFEPMEFEEGCLYMVIIKRDDGKFFVYQLVTSAPIVSGEQKHQIEEFFSDKYGMEVELKEYKLVKRK